MLDLDQILSTFSEIKPIDNISYKKDDLFICALGFEERCVVGIKKLESLGYKTRKAIYFRYSAQDDANRKNLVDLKKCLNKITDDDFEEFIFDRFQSNESFVEFEKKIESILNHNKNLKITLDITSIANTLITQILYFFITKRINFRIIYTEAKTYHPTEEEFKDYLKQIEEEGVIDQLLGQEIESNIILDGLEGEHHPGCTPILLVFVNFDYYRVQSALDYLDPPDFLFILGIPPKQERAWRLNAQQELFEHLPIGKKKFKAVTTFDYKDVFKFLENIYEEYEYSQTVFVNIQQVNDGDNFLR